MCYLILEYVDHDIILTTTKTHINTYHTPLPQRKNIYECYKENSSMIEYNSHNIAQISTVT